jgi:hypothetical protein
MEKAVLFILLLAFTSACHRDAAGPREGPGLKMIADHTPYIGGTNPIQPRHNVSLS